MTVLRFRRENARKFASAALPLALLSLLQAGTAHAATPTGAVLTRGPIAFPAGFMTSIKSYGAKGDGVTDDTAAIQRALADGRSSATADYNGKEKALYFPPGTYLVSNTLKWNGCCVTLQGAGTSSTVIRLAPSAPGFNNLNSPKSVIATAVVNLNQSHRQYIRDLGIRVGANNPGAVALTYTSNNTGSINDVAITSEDGKGAIGLDLTRKYPGPMMIKNLYVQGYQQGIATCVCYEYSVTIEGLTLNSQGTVGINDARETLNIRNVRSNNQVPFLVNNQAATVVIDASLGGGRFSNPAISSNATLYLRNIASSGYAETLLDSSTGKARTVRGTIAELATQTPMHLQSSLSAGSLKLPVQETPAASISSSEWAAFSPRWYGDTGSLQSTLDSGKHNVYFTAGTYGVNHPTSVIVPDAVQSIRGFASFVAGYGIQLVVDSDSPVPLIIEQFDHGISILHRGSRPLVVKDGEYGYTSAAGAGNVFLEDVALPQVTFQAGQNIWARQLDDEYAGTKILNNGNLWILGLKTEKAGTVIQTQPGAKTEVLGALIYPAGAVPSSNVAFTSSNAATSLIYLQSAYCNGCGYATQIQQSANGVSQKVLANPNTRFLMPLFVGN